MAGVRLTQAWQQIEAARKYTLQRLDDLREEDWFQIPGGVTHIAWQAGHLAFAEFRMCVARIRGDQPDDGQILPAEHLKQFGAGSTADPNASLYPSPDELLARLQRVHDVARQICAELSDADLDATCLKPHPLFNTKLGSLLWCSQHEMTHAGQIGLLRRFLGKKPLW